jgi:hypothetical protein
MNFTSLLCNVISRLLVFSILISFQGLENRKMPWKVDLSAISCQLNVWIGMLNVLSTSELCYKHLVTGEPVINFIFYHLFDISKRYFVYSFHKFRESKDRMSLFATVFCKFSGTRP